jgi:hypothetical protein
MRRLLWIGLGLAALGLLVREDDDEDDNAPSALLSTPFLLGLAIEAAIFALRNSQGRLLFPPQRS